MTKKNLFFTKVILTVMKDELQKGKTGIAKFPHEDAMVTEVGGGQWWPCQGMPDGWRK